MKGLLVTAIFLILSVPAAGKPTPASNLKSIEDPSPALARSDADITTESAGAARERDYFQPPRMHFDSGSFSCRLQSTIFNKTRLAQSCD